ncbi:serine/threonine protein kinase [Synechococcus sp. LTW-G]
MEDDPRLEPGALIGGRYRLERSLAENRWLASDQAAADASVHLLHLSGLSDEQREEWSKRWLQLQGVLHPQLPRFADLINSDRELWLPRPWQEGESFQALLEGGQTFDIPEVLELLRQLLPLMALLHSHGLSCRDWSPSQLLRRSADGLPVPLALEQPAPWDPQRDLLALGECAQALLGAEAAAALVSIGPLQALSSDRPELRFPSAAAALAAFQHFTPAVPAPIPLVRHSTPSRRRKRQQEQDAEGRLWPVVVALVFAALVGTALGWLVLSRGKVTSPMALPSFRLRSSLPAAEINQREQLLNRLRALQVDRRWFLKLVDASFLERGGRLPSDSQADAPLRMVWSELAEDWLSRVEQLPLPLRPRLGNLTATDWNRRQQGLVAQGLSPEVVQKLVSGSALNLLNGSQAAEIPAEPFRQLWYAAAEQALGNLQIELIEGKRNSTKTVSAWVPAGGARVFPIQVPPGSRLVLGVRGSALMQMSVFAADGQLLEARGPLRVVSLGEVKRSPVQVLISNDGLSSASLTLSLRVDPNQ